MGLYRISIRPEKLEMVPDLMKSIGFPILRTENQERGTCYYCNNPKRLRKNWIFWISTDKKTAKQFFLCGLSQMSRQIVDSLTRKGLFETYSKDLVSRSSGGSIKGLISEKD
jgi:hypothetical protein